MEAFIMKYPRMWPDGKTYDKWRIGWKKPMQTTRSYWWTNDPVRIKKNRPSIDLEVEETIVHEQRRKKAPKNRSWLFVQSRLPSMNCSAKNSSAKDAGPKWSTWELWPSVKRSNSFKTEKKIHNQRSYVCKEYEKVVEHCLQQTSIANILGPCLVTFRISFNPSIICWISHFSKIWE